MSSQSNSALMSDSNDEKYEQELEKRRQEAEAKLWEEEERQRAERKARKEARAAEKRRQEEELRRRAEEKETWRREEERQRDLAHRLEADRVATMEQQRRKNWMKTFLPSSPPSDENMNLIDLPPLTKRQCIRYLPQETPEVHQRREKLAKEIGVPAVGRGSPCERCADFGILCIPQNLP